jgi:hypothetical protein
MKVRPPARQIRAKYREAEGQGDLGQRGRDHLQGQDAQGSPMKEPRALIPRATPALPLRAIW